MIRKKFYFHYFWLQRHQEVETSLSGLLTVSVHDCWLRSWEKVTMSRMSFPHMSTEHYGALNTLPEQTLFGELRRGHITSNWQRFWVFKPDGVRGPAYLTHTLTEAALFLFPLFIFLQLYQVSSVETWPLLLSSVTSCTPQRTTGSLWSLSPLACSLYLARLATKKSVFMPPELGKKNMIFLV